PYDPKLGKERKPCGYRTLLRTGMSALRFSCRCADLQTPSNSTLHIKAKAARSAPEFVRSIDQNNPAIGSVFPKARSALAVSASWRPDPSPSPHQSVSPAPTIPPSTNLSFPATPSTFQCSPAHARKTAI